MSSSKFNPVLYSWPLSSIHHCWMLWIPFSKCVCLFLALKWLNCCMYLKVIQWLWKKFRNSGFSIIQAENLSSLNSSKFYWLAGKPCEIESLTTDTGSLRVSQIPWEHNIKHLSLTYREPVTKVSALFLGSLLRQNSVLQVMSWKC